MTSKKDSIFKYILREHKYKLLLTVLISSVSTLINIKLASLMMYIVDHAVPEKSINTLVFNITVYVLFCLGSLVIGFINGYLILDINIKLTTTVKPLITRRIMAQSGDYYIKNSGGEILQIVMSDVDRATVFLINNITSLITMILTLVGTIVYLCILKWWLCLTLFVLQPVTIIVNRRIMKKITAYSEKVRDYSGEYVLSLNEILTRPINVIISGLKNDCLDRAENNLIESYKYTRKQSLMGMMASNLNSVFRYLCMAIVLGCGGYCIIKNTMTVGALLVFVNYSGQMQSSIESIWELLLDYASLKPICKRVNAFFENVPVERTGKIADKETPNITFSNVSFSYDENKQIYDDMSCTFEFGKTYGIVGKTGEGKSTLVKLIYDLWKPQSGKVMLGGSDCSNLSPEEVSSVLAYVSADSLILRDTIYNNIILGNPELTRADAIEALRMARFYDEVCQMENGIDTMVGDNGVSLSSGQQQRLMLARAIAADKKIIIFDEPTSALDEKTEDGIIKDLYLKYDDRLIIIISHNEYILYGCDEVLRLKDGKFQKK